MRFNSDPKRAAVVIVSVCLRRLNRVEQRNAPWTAEWKNVIKPERQGKPGAILLYMKPVLLFSKIPNDIASVHYYALVHLSVSCTDALFMMRNSRVISCYGKAKAG